MLPPVDDAEFNHSGDLIVAIDDVRVRSERGLRDELEKLKPGDLAYVTVLRPLPGGVHQTIKIAIELGELRREKCRHTERVEQADASPQAARATRPGAEIYAD